MRKQKDSIENFSEIIPIRITPKQATYLRSVAFKMDRPLSYILRQLIDAYNEQKLLELCSTKIIEISPT